MIGETEEDKKELKEQLSKLATLGILKVDVSFSGSGDEGSIEEIIFTPELPDDTEFDRNKFDEILYDYLDPAKVGDWVNNEGGRGEIQIDVPTGTVTGTIGFYESVLNSEPFNDQL